MRTFSLFEQAAFHILCLALGWCSSNAYATQIIVDINSGETSLFNASTSGVDVAGYTIVSPSGTLDANNWAPIAGRLDAAGDGSFDGVANWILLSPADQSNAITEGAFQGPGGTLGVGESISLGSAWQAGSLQDLSATVLINNIPTATTIVFSPRGDYDWDGDVDIDDYSIFTADFGSSSNLRADGNNDGIVDAADYTVWRDAFGTTATISASLSALAVPEPTALHMIILGLAGASANAGVWRRRATWRD